jgi:hypothetical protein
MKPLIPSDLHARSERERPAPKLMFFGDPHGDFEPVITAVERFRPEAIVLLGDLQARQPLQIELQSILPLTEVHWIHGNHDTDGDLDYRNLFESDLADRSLHCRIVSVAGYRVAGLGGIFRSKIWDPRRPIEEAAFQSSDAMRRTMKRHGLAPGVATCSPGRNRVGSSSTRFAGTRHSGLRCCGAGLAGQTSQVA